MLSDSILDSIKKLLGMTADYTNFDTDIVIHINSVFMILNQLGVGPSECFKIADDLSTWEDFMEGSEDIDAVKSFIYLKVKSLFDPPISSAVVEANKEAIKELEWRLNIQSD